MGMVVESSHIIIHRHMTLLSWTEKVSQPSLLQLFGVAVKNTFSAGVAAAVIHIQ